MKKETNKLRSFPVLILFLVFLFGFSLLNLFWPKRERSELENRKLAQLPAFSLADFLSGEWSADFSSYMQDQFALRDSWINAESFTNAAVLQKAEEGDILYGKDHWMFTKLFDDSAAEQQQLSKNVSAVSKFAAAHPGRVTFLLAPSASVIYKEELPAGAPMIDEDAALDSIFAQVSQTAAVIDLREVFTQNKAQYLYYKTDHHWTTNGAYLAYAQFCAQNSLTPFDPAAHEAREVTDFYGTHYSTARLWNAVPDTITWYPLANAMTVYQATGEASFTPLQTESMVNEEKFFTRDKYAAFLDGNNGYSVIEGSGTGSILVIKDSYANSFVPFLTENYAKIGVLDFRNFGYGPDALIEAEGYDQILVLYNFQTFRTDTHLINMIRPSAGA